MLYKLIYIELDKNRFVLFYLINLKYIFFYYFLYNKIHLLRYNPKSYRYDLVDT